MLNLGDSTTDQVQIRLPRYASEDSRRLKRSNSEEMMSVADGTATKRLGSAPKKLIEA